MCNWTTVFIDGNHENFDMLDQLPTEKKFGAEVGVVRECVFHLKRGFVYEINQHKIFSFGGASSIDRDNRTPYLSWWPREIPSYEEFERGLCSLDEIQWEVDYVITHTAPNKILEQYLSSNRSDAVTNYLEIIAEKIKFKRWFFGHFHDDAEFDKFTLVYNKFHEL